MSTISSLAPDLHHDTEAARSAQGRWADVPVRQRLRRVKAFRHLLVREADRLAEVIALEVGKPPEEALGGEVLPTASACRFLECEAHDILRPRRVGWGARPVWMFGQSDVIHRRPRGVVGIIGTWNYPLFLNAIQIVQALTAGNAVLWKPSEVTPQFGEILHGLFLEAGFPADLLRRLPATREMGPTLAGAAIDHMVFTGSATVGRKLAARLGERLVSSTLELSGCDVQLVLEDADVPLAARAAWFGATLNRGQTCIAVRRVLVAEGLYSDFCDQLRRFAVTGQARPLTLAPQAHQAARLIDEAVSEGAKVLVPGENVSSEGVCRPVILIDARPDMTICREAIFAPVQAVMPFRTIDEALEMEARCPFALGASIFTRDHARGQQLAGRLRAGAVAVNDVIFPTAHPATPFGGTGASGWGVTQGREGLLEMTVPQVVSVRGGTFRPHYDTGDPVRLAAKTDLLRGFLEAGHAGTLLGRMRGWWRVIRSARKGI